MTVSYSPRQFCKDANMDIIYTLIDNWEKFEKNGAIGDCPLRKIASSYVKSLGGATVNVTTVMRDVAFEAYREFYNRCDNDGIEPT